jgi:hypothetical protein
MACLRRWGRSCAGSRTSCASGIPRHSACRACALAGADLVHAVPAHLRHLVAAAIGLALAFEPSNFRTQRPGMRPRPGVSAPRCVRAASACPHTRRRAAWWLRRAARLPSGPRLSQLVHAVAHRALAGQHDAVGRIDLLLGLAVRITRTSSASAACVASAACDRPPAIPSAGCPCRSRRHATLFDGFRWIGYMRTLWSTGSCRRRAGRRRARHAQRARKRP